MNSTLQFLPLILFYIIVEKMSKGVLEKVSSSLNLTFHLLVKLLEASMKAKQLKKEKVKRCFRLNSTSRLS